MALLYKKRVEGNVIIYNFAVKTRWFLIVTIFVGFVLFLVAIKFSTVLPYAVPMFIISLPLFLGGLSVAIVESYLYTWNKMRATRSTVKNGEIRLEK